MNDSKQWVHIIGISGVATSGIALMYKNLGWKVTGSDKGFFPPVSTFLRSHEIEIYPGFKAERLSQNGKHPDLVIIQGTKGLGNPELVEARMLKLPVKTYPEIIAQDIIKPQASIVVVGTYGKTTISAALVKIMQNAGIEISYMFGGIDIDGLPHVRAKTENTRFSIVEGDEYIISTTDHRAKFELYSPTHLIINAIEWEHPDVYKTEAAYLEAFIKLVKSVPAHGLIVANANDKLVVEALTSAKAKVVFYSAVEDKQYIAADWVLTSDSKPLPTFIRKPVNKSAEIIPYEKNIVGDFNEENLLAASVMAYELGIRKERIQEAIASFKGVKRRLEIKKQTEKLIVIDDFGSSPPKAKGALAALRKDYPEAKIVVVFEPNSGNRVEEAVTLYAGAFADADKVYFPRFTHLPKTSQKRYGATELAEKIKTHVTVEVEEDDKKLLNKLLAEKADNLTIFCFLGSHGFRNLIPDLCSRI